MGDATVDIDPAYVKKMNLKTGLPKPLNLEEKKYLLAVERGDMANVRRMLQKAHQQRNLNIDCVDSLGRASLTQAIDGENLEMVELLVIMGVQTKDALLHAINAEFVEAVELLLEHEELIHKDGEPYSWQTVDFSIATFTPDITPLVLAAHRNNYEILKILLDRGATIPMPHDVKCGCDACIRESSEDSLRHSQSRLNEYRALASPSLIALSSSDPLLTTFKLSWELRCLAFAEPECKAEYLELRKQCQQFAVDLLQQARTSEELAVILNHDPDSPPYEDGDHMKLARLELAIIYKQKSFVAHPNIQQLLSALWYEGVPGFRRKSNLQKIIILVQTAALFPFYCTLYMIAPSTHTGKLMRKPFMKFLIHASSYLFFLFILILVSQRVEDHLIHFFGTDSMKAERFIKQRGKPPAILEYVVLLYVLGHIYEETYEIYVEGILSYLRNLWNVIDCSRNFLFVMVILLRLIAYIQQRTEISYDPSRAYIPREQWNAFDPQLIAEGLFAAANIFSALKLVHLFSINPHLGPLQISLGRMVIDIVKFFFIYSLVLFAFACGLNQLLWYFADLERQKCYKLPNGEPDWENAGDSCLKWRCFANVFESSQSLFWASFGMVELANFELTGIKTYTRFWGLLMFGSYSVINVIVLLNLLIAMMSNSYAAIDEHSDTEWKFARTKLWMSYFEEGNTLPPPFNIFPTMKIFMKLFRLRQKDRVRKMSTKRRNKEEKERDYRYSSVMRALVWRYISAMHKKCEENPVTEDDINELKNDVSAFRFDVLEVLNKNGMDISCVEKGDKAILGKKMKVWERRLMKDFEVAPVVSEEEEQKVMYEPPPENEDPLSKFRRVAKLAVLTSNLNKWGQLVQGACLASQIGHCNSSDAFKQQQNLLRAMEAARQYKDREPTSVSKSFVAMDLPDTTGQSIIELINDIKTPLPTHKEHDQTIKIFLEPATPKIVIDSDESEKGEESEQVGDFIDLASSPSSPEIKSGSPTTQNEDNKILSSPSSPIRMKSEISSSDDEKKDALSATSSEDKKMFLSSPSSPIKMKSEISSSDEEKKDALSATSSEDKKMLLSSPSSPIKMKSEISSSDEEKKDALSATSIEDKKMLLSSPSSPIRMKSESSSSDEEKKDALSATSSPKITLESSTSQDVKPLTDSTSFHEKEDVIISISPPSEAAKAEPSTSSDTSKSQLLTSTDKPVDPTPVLVHTPKRPGGSKVTRAPKTGWL